MGKQHWETMGENARAMNVSGDTLLRFPDVLLNLTHVTILREKAPAKVESTLETSRYV